MEKKIEELLEAVKLLIDAAKSNNDFDSDGNLRDAVDRVEGVISSNFKS